MFSSKPGTYVFVSFVHFAWPVIETDFEPLALWEFIEDLIGPRLLPPFLDIR